MAQGSWWRFDRYEIRNSCVCPAPGARLFQYDPWAQYCASRTGDGSIDPPYASLLTLVGALEVDPETVIEGNEVLLGNNGLQRLIQWCSEYGLLGLLSHQTVLASLAPRWENAISARACVPIRRVHRWDAYGWSATFDAWLPPTSQRPDEIRSGDLVSPMLYAGVWSEPLALVHMIRDGGWATQHLAEAWGPYFPDVPPAERNTYTYPVPESDAFWAEYCEPSAWLLGAASQLRAAILDLNLDDAWYRPQRSFSYRIDARNPRPSQSACAGAALDHNRLQRPVPPDVANQVTPGIFRAHGVVGYDRAASRADLRSVRPDFRIGGPRGALLLDPLPRDRTETRLPGQDPRTNPPLNSGPLRSIWT